MTLEMSRLGWIASTREGGANTSALMACTSPGVGGFAADSTLWSWGEGQLHQREAAGDEDVAAPSITFSNATGAHRGGDTGRLPLQH